jgi:hypothetical protein
MLVPYPASRIELIGSVALARSILTGTLRCAVENNASLVPS